MRAAHYKNDRAAKAWNERIPIAVSLQIARGAWAGRLDFRGMRNPREHHMSIGAAMLLAFSTCAMAPAVSGARLPWAATNGLAFVDAVVAANNYSGAAGGLAIKKSPSPDVRAFGRMIWEDSIKSTQSLRWRLNTGEGPNGEAPGVVLPSRVNPHYMFVLDELIPLNGAAFDTRFIQQQESALKEFLMLAETFARSGDDLELKEFAARSVPTIKKQLDAISAIAMRHRAAG
jgi:putative membrane protein